MSFTRRHFLATTTAAVAATTLPAAAVTKPAVAGALPFRYAFSAISWETDIETAVKAGEKLGLGELATIDWFVKGVQSA